MNKDLKEFIELCLVDGVISDKEREVILRKSEELGVPKDECEILIDSLTILQNKTTSSNDQVVKIQTEKKVDISFIDDTNYELWKYYFESFGDELKNEVESIDSKFQDHIKYNYRKEVTSIFVSEYTKEEVLKELTSFSLFSKSELKSMFGSHKLELTNFLNNTDYEIYSIIPLEDNNGNKQLIIFSDKDIRVFSNSKFKNPYMFSKDMVEEIIIFPLNLKLFQIDDFLNKLNPISGTTYLSTLLTYDFCDIVKSILTFNFLKTIMRNRKLKNISLNQDKMMNFLKSIKVKIDEKQLKQIIKLHHLICKKTEEYNESNKFDYNFSYPKGGFPSCGVKGYYIDLEDWVIMKKSQLNFILTLIRYRNSLINLSISGDTVNYMLLFEQLDDIGVFNNSFQREVLDKLDEINRSLSEINQTLYNGFNNICDSIENIEIVLNETNSQLEGVKTNIGFSNLLHGINTYQNYKIRKLLK